MAYWDFLERAHCYTLDRCNCEPMTRGIIEQPQAVLSSQGWVIFALVVLIASFRKTKLGPEYTSPLVRDLFYRRFVGCFILWLGFSSTSLHSTFTKLGEWMDFTAIAMMVNVIASYGGSVLGRDQWSRKKFVTTWAMISFPQLVLVWLFTEQLKFAAIFVSVGILAYELTKHRNRGFRGPNHYLYPAITLFIIGPMLISLDFFRPWCWPIPYLYSHTLWHIVATTGTFFTFEYFRHEKFYPELAKPKRP